MIGGLGSIPEEILARTDLIKTSPTGVNFFYESPAHFESAVILREIEETDAMKLGTAIHMAVLEPDRFADSYVKEQAAPEGTLVTADDIKAVLKELGAKCSGSKADLKARLRELNPGAVFYDEWHADFVGNREWLKLDEWKSCERIAQRINQKPKLKYMISGGEAEQKAWWIHEKTGVLFSMRMDYVKRFDKPIAGCAGVIVDVKKVPKGKTRRRSFEGLIWDRAMFIQAAIYVDGMEKITGEKWMFLWVAVEDKAPYSVMGFPADFGLLEAGRNEYNKALIQLADCWKSNYWPCYSDDLVTVSLPAYAWNQLEVRDDENE